MSSSPQVRAVRMFGSGRCLPGRAVSATELDARLGWAAGTVAKRSGVMRRSFAAGETSSQMGAVAAQAALSGLPAAVTVHEMVPAIDEGPTLFQALLDVAPGASVPTATEALLVAFPALLSRALDHIARDLQPVVLTPPPLASYDPVPDDATIARYHRRQL